MKTRRLYRPAHVFFLVSTCVFLATVAHSIAQDTGGDNLHVHQARSFLNGKLDIPEKQHDVAIYDGHYYVPFPPFPAILITPLLALFGTVNTTLVALMLTIMNVFTLRSIFMKLEVDARSIHWLLLAMFLGTGYWMVVRDSIGVWYFSQVVAISFILLSVREAMVSGRGLVAGLFLGCAILSRQLSVYSAIFIFAALLLNRQNRSKTKRILAGAGFITTLSVCIGFYLVFNAVRFGDPLDTGYSYIELVGFLRQRVEEYGLFHPIYVPFNFIYMFFQGPHMVFTNPYSPSEMDPFGTSITFASPFVFSALYARGGKAFIISAWLTIAASVTHMMLYNANGFIQVNAQRYALDFVPVLMVLVGLSVKTIDKRLLCWCVGYAVALNAIALFVLPVWGWWSR